ncbi:MAG: hypothetical protein P1U89_01625 [Verrucomicrobiales bacterium]|nr:hypothetical protein [Verrucomicrobiales bacterium]
MSEQIESLRSSLEKSPDNWETRFSLINALHQEGLTNEAVDLLSEITALPSDDRSIIYAAQSYQILGANEQAQSVYETALSLNPSNEYAKAGLRSLGIEPDEVVAQAEPVAQAVVLDDDDVEVATAVPAVKTPVPLSPDNVGSKTITLEDAVSANQPKGGHSMAEVTTPPPVITKDDTIPYDPDTAVLVDHIQEAEEESKRRHKAAIARDRINSVIVTILVHVGIVLALTMAIQQIPRRVPPQIVASSSADTNEPSMEQQVMKKNTLKSTSASDASAANILSVPSVSSISMTSMDSFTGSDIPVETGMTFQPSMSMGMPSSSNSMMMFGQPMEGETLGVVLDVSGSMAEWLPLVIREVDKNFKDAPIVYINNAKIEKTKSPVEIRPIVKEEVVPRRADGTHSPFWFLWGDLPRKAPQRSVDRLIETFKTRPNQFLAVGQKGHWGGGDRLGEAMKFLAKENCDAVYVFSDFEDFIDEEVALEHGRSLAQRKVRAYIQPAVEESEFIKVMAQKVANRTKGRQLPTLSSVLGKDEKEGPAPLVPPRPTTTMTKVPGTNYATPRIDQIGKAFYDFKPPKGSTEITRLEEPEFDAVFYGPKARAAIFLKDKDGAYIQAPIEFAYHSNKELPDHPDTAYRWRSRKFLRLDEQPSFDGKEIVWKMILEDELKFTVHLYLDRKGMNATYVADPPKDGTTDHAYIYFKIPPLAVERKDRYYGQDAPEGLSLDDARLYAKPNTVTLNLPRQERDRFASQWSKLGFEPGYNTRSFDTLFTSFPSGIRDMKVEGPSFGERIFHARTTSSKILLNGGAWRGDTEPWEGFHARLHRPGDTRTRFTKTEAIAIQIE